MQRIDTHHHAIPSFYRDLLRKAEIDAAGGRGLPEWSPEASLQTMGELDVATAILSVSTPGTTFLPSLTDAVSLARDVNDYLADLVAAQPDRFGFFATVPTPHVDESAAEVVRSLDELGADGVVLLANSAGTYLGQEGQDELFAALDARSAVVFIHPAELPGPAVDGVLPFATDFLLDTTRAAYLLVRNEICRRYPEIRFILSHAGGFVPYASHRMAVGIMSDTGRSLTDSLDDFAGFYFDTALSSSAAALPSLLAFAKPDTSPSARTGPSPRSRPGSCSPPVWKPTPDSTPTPARRSSAPTRCHCSRASGQHRRPMPTPPPIKYGTR